MEEPAYADDLRKIWKHYDKLTYTVDKLVLNFNDLPAKKYTAEIARLHADLSSARLLLRVVERMIESDEVEPALV